MNLFDIVAPMTMAEAKTDYQKRREHEKRVEMGNPTTKPRQSKQTDYAKKRAQDKRDMALGEDSWHAGDNDWSSEQHEMVENTEPSAVAGAIVRRIMMQRTDLLKQYGPELVGAAIDNVADYVGDVEEIGSSDVSGWVNQVERMLKENPPEAFDEQELDEFAPSPERDDDEVPDQILQLANRWWNATDDQPKITNVLRSLGWSISQVESEDDAVQMQHNDGTTYFISADDFDPDVFEGWSDAAIARRTGSPRTPYSVYIKGKKWKDFENDDHARAVMDKLITKFEAEGRDPSVITIAPADYDKGVKETVWFPTVNVPKFPKPEVDATKWVVNYKIPATGETKIVAVAGDTEEQARENLLARNPAAKIVSIKSKDMSEAIVASGPSQPLDDRAVRKLVWDTMKINADTGEQAIQRALSVLAKKPQSRMVQDLQDKFQSLADRLAQGLAEAGSPAQQAAIAIAKKEQGIDEVKQRLDAKCWKGKHKEGTKIKGGVRVNNCVPNESVEEALSKKDLLKQVGDKLNDPEFRKQPADPTKRWEKGDLYQGPGPDDYGYTGYQGHGMPTDKAERARIRADKKKGVAEMDKSQKGAAGWNIDDYPLGAKGTTAKPTTVKNVVKSATKDLNAAFDQADKKKPKPVKESYWTKLQNERNTKLNSLVNELKESIKK